MLSRKWESKVLTQVICHSAFRKRNNSPEVYSRPTDLQPTLGPSTLDIHHVSTFYLLYRQDIGNRTEPHVFELVKPKVWTGIELPFLLPMNPLQSQLPRSLLTTATPGLLLAIPFLHHSLLVWVAMLQKIPFCLLPLFHVRHIWQDCCKLVQTLAFGLVIQKKEEKEVWSIAIFGYGCLTL
jgi:hypothetical protein